MEYITEKAFAKINLYLDIEKKRDDGFHDLLTLMQIIDYYDEVEIRLDDYKETLLTMNNCSIDIPMKKNIAYLAAQSFYDHLDFVPKSKPYIVINKKIPAAAGLAGGSADAAAVLRGLNYLFGKPYTTEDLCKLGSALGSDVPFNIVGGVQLCRDKGDYMYQTYGIRNYSILVTSEGEKLSTAEQYRRLDELYNNFVDYPIKEQFQQVYLAFTTGRCSEAFGGMYNIFEKLYENENTFRKIKQIMYENEAKVAMLSGSGPSIFGVFPDCLYAEDAQEALAKEGIKSFVCRPINKTYEYILPNTDPWR